MLQMFQRGHLTHHEGAAFCMPTSSTALVSLRTFNINRAREKLEPCSGRHVRTQNSFGFHSLARNLSLAEIYLDEPGPALVAHGKSTAFTPEFEELCEAQCKLLAHALDSHLQATFYARTPDSWRTGQLEMQQVSPESNLPPVPINLGTPEYERALLGLKGHMHNLKLPNGFAVPVFWKFNSYSTHVVGLLVLEYRLGANIITGAGHKPYYRGTAPYDSKAVELVTSSLSMAYAMEMGLRHGHASLQSAASQQAEVRELVEEARRPLATLRTLGGNLRAKTTEGHPAHDMLQGVSQQADHLDEIVQQLQAALHPPRMGALRFTTANSRGEVTICNTSYKPISGSDWGDTDQRCLPGESCFVEV